MASAPFSTAARAQSQSPAGESNSGGRPLRPGIFPVAGRSAGSVGLVADSAIELKLETNAAKTKILCGLARGSGFRLTLAMRALVVGCGYVGLPLATELARLGHEVFGLRRDATALRALEAAGIHPLAADITRPGDLEKL